MEVNKLKLILKYSKSYKGNWISSLSMKIILWMHLKEYGVSIFNVGKVIDILIDMKFLEPAIDKKEFLINPKMYDSV